MDSKLQEKENRPSVSFKQNLSDYFSQYCGSTSIHGIKYLGERERFAIEKFAWSLVIATVAALSLFTIYRSYYKWQTSPVIVTFATTEMPIWKIPFPAVTICPEVKYNPEIFNFTNILVKKMTSEDTNDDEDFFYEALSLVCKRLDLPFGKFDQVNSTIDEVVVMGLLLGQPDFDPLGFSNIKWLGKMIKDPLKVLSLTITSEGLCYTFNSLDIEEILRNPEPYRTNKTINNTHMHKWSLEDGYQDDFSLDNYPRRTFLSGVDGGFIFNGLYTNHSHLDYICSDFFQGFKVVLHHPMEFPNMDKSVHVPLDTAVWISVLPQMTTVVDELKPYPPKKRKCFFTFERKLQNFDYYTQENCLNECLSNHTLLKCGCLPFYMPKNYKAPICGAAMNPCIKKSKVEYFKFDKRKCSCLPSCTLLQYDMEITSTNWDWRKTLKILSDYSGSELDSISKQTHLSKLHVFYKDMQFLPAERHELYGILNFLSNTGGLLGLFIGFSITSLIEIIYFLTLRWYCNVRKFGIKFWSGENISADVN